VVWVRSVSRDSQEPKSLKKKRGGGAEKNDTSNFVFLILRVILSSISIERIVISSYPKWAWKTFNCQRESKSSRLFLTTR
jgi:hypothetical protein